MAVQGLVQICVERSRIIGGGMRGKAQELHMTIEEGDIHPVVRSTDRPRNEIEIVGRIEEVLVGKFVLFHYHVFISRNIVEFSCPVSASLPPGKSI